MENTNSYTQLVNTYFISKITDRGVIAGHYDTDLELKKGTMIHFTGTEETWIVMGKKTKDITPDL